MTKASSKRKGTVRKWVRRTHLVLALLAGAVLSVVGLTGSALVYHQSIDQWLQPKLHQVKAKSQNTSLAHVVQRIQAEYPGETLHYVRLPTSDDEPYQLRFVENERRIYANPSTGGVLGVVRARDTFGGFMLDLHQKLLLGAIGKTVVGIVGFGLLLLIATGLWLWWPGMRRIGRGFWISWRKSWPRTIYDVHRVIGAVAVPLLIVTSVTGIGLVFYNVTLAGLQHLFGDVPSVPPQSAEVPQRGQRMNLDALLEKAHQAIPSAEPTWAYLPRKADEPFAVRQRLPSEWHPSGKSFVYLNPYDGSVLQRRPFDEAGTGRRVYTWLYPLHIGEGLGPIYRALTCALGFVPALLMATGLTLWLRRWRSRRRQRRYTGSSTPFRPRQSELQLRNS